MPVIDKSSPDHSNGESGGGALKEVEPTKLKQGEAVTAQEPANQVHDGDSSEDCHNTLMYSYDNLGCFHL